MSTRRAAPPQLLFDDGSRIMTEESTSEIPAETPLSIRGSTPLEIYYEIDRITQEIVTLANDSGQQSMLKVAVQFPDELLNDAPEVCWALEESLGPRLEVMPLVFCLGDTTVGSCCPDEVAALHLQADVLVHYGHACLNPTGTLPVIYSFGMLEIDVPNAIQSIVENEQVLPTNILLLYQVGYYYAINDFQKQLVDKGNVNVVTGEIPKPTGIRKGSRSRPCCGGESTSCSHNESSSELQPKNIDENCPVDNELTPSNESTKTRPLVVGGLELPEVIQSWDQLSDYTILYVGDSESASQRQYTNTMLRFLSLPNPPNAYWTYSPKEKSLTTSLPAYLQRQLKRRFFLSQKARDAHVFGVLVSNLSQQHLIDVVKSLKQRIENAEKSSYSFAVGKINPAKLANFAEIECFVLVACREHSLLGDEREYHVPVITPLELEIALDNLTWGAQAYSLDCHDVLEYMPQVKDPNEEDAEDDAPYFSLVTGTYTQKTISGGPSSPTDLESLPGKGQVTAYKSEAANFLKQREYQGLSTLAGQTEAKAAIEGQTGIASNYGGT